MFEMLSMRAAEFLHDCQEGCSIRSCLAGFLLFFLVLSPLIEHNTQQHVSGVDWLRDEPVSRLSAITTAQGLGLTFIGPHCTVQCVTFPLGWDKPVTAGPNGQQPGRLLPPLPPLSSSSAHSVPVPKHGQTSARPQPSIRAPVRPSFQAVVMLLYGCLHKDPQ